MNKQDCQVLEAMRKYGGGFMKALSEAGSRADSVNLAKIKAAFPEYWAEYTHLAELDKDRQ